MNSIQKQTLIEAVVYILNKTKGIAFYYVFKILYFAEKKHLCQWGSRIIDDAFLAYEYGPVLKDLYSVVKAKKRGDKTSNQLLKMFDESIAFAGEDASNVLLAKRDANLDYLSDSDISCLDESIKENSTLSFDELKNKSHDAAWEEAFRCHEQGGSDVIDTIDIARAAGANDEMISYIKEQLQTLVLA